MSFFVYILECKDGSYYTGYAKDVNKRFILHCTGHGASYTKSHPPLKIIHSQEFPTKSEAMKEEFRIKKLSKHKKVELILDS